MLKLYPDCPMMLTENTDVPNGQANGTRVLVKSITSKVGETPITVFLECGTAIPALFAHQVESILVQHENPKIHPSSFLIAPKSWTFKANLTIDDHSIVTDMKGSQFPIISNTATTGHKLQGCSLDSLFVNEWHYHSNWAYVVLSRVRTMKGLYIQSPLTENLDEYLMPEEMTRMIRRFERTIALTELRQDDYEPMLADLNRF